jgi:hypothetical protein
MPIGDDLVSGGLCDDESFHISVPGGQSGMSALSKHGDLDPDLRQYIIRAGIKPRLRSKLYLFNSFGMVGKMSGAVP